MNDIILYCLLYCLIAYSFVIWYCWKEYYQWILIFKEKPDNVLTIVGIVLIIFAPITFPNLAIVVTIDKYINN